MTPDELSRRQEELRRRSNNAKSTPDAPSTQPSDAGYSVALERHYTINQLAEMWGLSHSTILRHFKGEPGVLHIGNVNSRRRTKISLRIPLSVAERVHKRLSLME